MIFDSCDRDVGFKVGMPRLGCVAYAVVHENRYARAIPDLQPTEQGVQSYGAIEAHFLEYRLVIDRLRRPEMWWRLYQWLSSPQSAREYPPDRSE